MLVQPKYTLVKRLGPVVVLRPKKDLLGDAETEELEQVLAELDEEGVSCLVVNLADVGLVSSRGFAAMIRGHIKFSQRGARVSVCQLTRKVQNVYVIIKLGLILPAYDTEEQAIAGCSEKEG